MARGRAGGAPPRYSYLSAVLDENHSVMLRPSFALTVLGLLLGTALGAENWPEFRGPSGQGHFHAGSLPIEWGPDKNVVWKQAIPGLGWSSPVVSEGRVYL